jgi:hypothetical protein
MVLPKAEYGLSLLPRREANLGCFVVDRYIHGPQARGVGHLLLCRSAGRVAQTMQPTMLGVLTNPGKWLQGEGLGFKVRVWRVRVWIIIFPDIRCQVTAQSGLISYGRILIRAKPSVSWQTTPKPSSFLLSHSYHHHISSDSLHSTQGLSRRGRFLWPDS